MKSLDAIVIGAGSAGLSAAQEISQHTDNFLLVDRGPLGTTCARTGCMPSKALLQIAHDFERTQTFAKSGIENASNLKVNGHVVMQRIRTLRDQIVSSVMRKIASFGDHFIEAEAEIISPFHVRVKDQIYEAKNIVLALGSRPALPDFIAKWNTPVLDTNSFFELEELPKEIAILGLGSTGLEMADALACLGVHVQAYEESAHLAHLRDPAIQTVAKEIFKKKFSFITDQEILVEADAQKKWHITADGQKNTHSLLFTTIGRQSNLDSLKLNDHGFKVDKQGLPEVNPRTLQLKEYPHIYAVGDANEFLPFQHEASDQGRWVGHMIIQKEKKMTFRPNVPMSILYTRPQIAVVGERYDKVDRLIMRIGTADFERQGRAIIAQENQGMLNIYAHAATGRIVGAEMCCPHAEHFAHILALAIQKEMMTLDLLNMPFYHPSFEEGLRTALVAASPRG